MYQDIQQWAEMRQRVLVEGVSKRQVMRGTGLYWDALQKVLAHVEPPDYWQTKPAGLHRRCRVTKRFTMMLSQRHP